MAAADSDLRPANPIAPEIRAALAGLRWRIRAYVVVEGIAVAAIWLGAAFWLSLALDYLPILAGASEMPRPIRAALLVITAAGALGLFYWYVLRRVAVRLADRSMAVLLERRYREFGDSLLTAVEMAELPERTETFNPAMLDATKRLAERKIPDVRLRNLFNFRPLVWRVLAAVGLAASVLAFATANSPFFSQAAERLWLLRDEPWPRRSKIQVVGIELQRPDGVSQNAEVPALLTFDDGPIKVARGASFNLRVVADASAVVPEYCSIRYWTADNEFGSVRMKKIGRVRVEESGGQQRSVQGFAFDGKPFKGILSSLSFDVVGNDHRVGSYAVDVVDSPAVVETKLDCEFPAYMVDEATSSWLPRTLDYLPSGTQLPRGARVVIRGKANKDLRRVVVRNLDTLEETRIDVAGEGDAARSFSYPVAGLLSNLSLEVVLVDRDQVFSDRPFRVALAAVPDDAPRIETRLRGIGSAVTPDVVVPLLGKVTDDYQINSTWADVQVGDAEPRKEKLALGREGALQAELDFRELRSNAQPIELKPTEKLRLRVLADDRFKLGDEGPNLGTGELYELDVVTPEELLRLLESRELGLRRRFEQIIEETTEMRDSLLRVKVELASAGKETAAGQDAAGQTGAGKDAAGKDAAGKDAAGKDAASRLAGAEPGDESPDGETAAQRAQSLRLLRVQRAIQQSQKSSQEVLGVALSFADIREELINNRVDTEDRKDRLKEQISDPLQKIVAERFPALEKQLAELEKSLGDAKASVPLSESASEQSELLLADLGEVLQKMLDLETYNELLDIVRDLIKEQTDLLDKTRQQKKRQLLELTE
jgi:hypothetical protein